MKPSKLRTLAAQKSKVVITSRRRSKRGFRVTGPDGKQHDCPTFKEAAANLAARLRCHPVAVWKLETIKAQGGAK